MSYPSPFRDRPPERVAGLRVTLIGHASFLYQVAGLNILIDPVFSDRASPFGFAGPLRTNPPGIAFDDLPPIDAVLVTHNHYDHMDTATLERLRQRFSPRFIAPLGNDVVVRKEAPEVLVETGDWGHEFRLSDTVSAHLVPAYHWSARWLGDRRMALWCAFVLTTPQGAIYHIGDTGYGDGAIFREVRQRFGAPALLSIPIGAYEPRWFMAPQHVNPEEAVRIFTAAGVGRALGIHWGTFKLTDEAREAPREARWVPSRVAFQGAIARFSDAACTASIPTKSAADAVCPLTAIAVFTGQCSAASYHTLGAPLDPAELYEIDPRGACVRATSSSNSAGGSPTTFSFRLGAPIPVDAFARATTIEAGTGLVRRRGWGGPGGAASVWSDVVDVRVGACAVDAAVDGVRRCLPAKSVSIDLWADESCGTPAFIAPSDTCSPPLPRFVRATSAGDEGARVYEVLGATKTLFEGTSETCRPTTLPASVTGYALAEVDVSGFVPVSEVER